MFLGYSTINYDTELTGSIILNRRKFSTAVFHGNAILDNVHCRNSELSKTELENLPMIKQLWIERETNYLSNFEDTLASGNVTNPITGFRLKRKRSDETTFKTLKSFDADTLEFEDWTAANQWVYEYAIHALSSTIESVSATNTGSLDFDGYNITDGTDSFMLYINLKNSQIPTIGDVVIQEGYTQYPTVSFGQRNAKQGNIECMPLTHDGNRYVSELSVLENIDAFINNRKIKLLKNSKGQAWWVATHNFSHTFLEEFIEKPFVINFDWVQVGNGSDPFVGGVL